MTMPKNFKTPTMPVPERNIDSLKTALAFFRKHAPMTGRGFFAKDLKDCFTLEEIRFMFIKKMIDVGDIVGQVLIP